MNTITIELPDSGASVMLHFSQARASEHRVHASVRLDGGRTLVELFADGEPDTTRRGPAAWGATLDHEARTATVPGRDAVAWEVTGAGIDRPEATFRARAAVARAIEEIGRHLAPCFPGAALILAAPSMAGWFGYVRTDVRRFHIAEQPSFSAAAARAVEVATDMVAPDSAWRDLRPVPSTRTDAVGATGCKVTVATATCPGGWRGNHHVPSKRVPK